MRTFETNTEIEVLIGLGSNLDQPLQQIKRAITAISDTKNISLLRASSLYKSSPQGPQDQEDFCNAAILIRTSLSPEHLLLTLQAIENDFGRIKTRHWGERVIDLDILYYGQMTIEIDTPDLHIPHREALSRDFVMTPVLEVAPNWCLPNGALLRNFQEACLNHQLIKLDS